MAEQEHEIQSLLIEGFDETKVEKESTYDEAVLSVIRAVQNDMVLKAEVFSFETHEIGEGDKKRKMRVAVLKLPNDSKRTVKGILPFEFSDEPDRNHFQSLFGRTIHVKVENYQREDDGKFTFVGNRVKARELAREMTFRKVEQGDTLISVVQFVSDRYVFVDVGGLTVPIAVNELSYEWISNLQSKYKIGQHLKVKVLELDKEKQTMRVSAKAALENPWDFVPERYVRNAEVLGRVTGVVDFGSFVNIEAGVDVLCRHLRHQQVEVGNRVRVRIEDIDVKKQRIQGRILSILNM